MPGTDEEGRFKRDALEGALLKYVRKMKHFYESQLDELSQMVGEKTEHRVTVTRELLEKIEERLSEFEEKEKDLIDNYRKCVRETEGVAF